MFNNAADSNKSESESLDFLIGNQLEVRTETMHRFGEIATIAIVDRTLKVQCAWVIEWDGRAWTPVHDLSFSIQLVFSPRNEADHLPVDRIQLNSTEQGSFVIWRYERFLPPRKNALAPA